jgi:hypothetical protein
MAGSPRRGKRRRRVSNSSSVQERPTFPLPATSMDPVESADFTPFARAVYWIASRKGEIEITSNDRLPWEIARTSLLDFIRSKKVSLIGRRDGSYASIAASELTNIAVEDSLFDIGETPGRFLLCCYCHDNETWMRGLCDRISQHRREPPQWTHLQVNRAEVIAALESFDPMLPRTMPSTMATTELKGDELDAAIRNAVRTAISDQAARGGKKLNVNGQRVAAMKVLAARGIKSRTGGLQDRVRQILKETEFKHMRGRQGARVS